MGNNTPKTAFTFLQIIGDILFLNLAIILAFLIRFIGQLPTENIEPYFALFPLISLAAFFLFKFYGLYDTVNKVWSEIFASLIISLTMLMIYTISLSYLFQGFKFPRTVFFIALLTQIVILGLWRYMLMVWERKLTPVKRVIIIAPHNEVELIAQKLNYYKNQLLGVLIDCLECRGNLEKQVVLGDYTDIERVCLTHGPDEIIMSGEVPRSVKNNVSMACLKYGWQVYVIPGVYEILVHQSATGQVKDTPVFKISPGVNNGKEQVKRLFDCVISIVILLATLPITIVAALLIKLDSPGPLFYCQERVGKYGKRFILLKFRTMQNNAEAQTGPVLCSEKDPRITRVGRYLRLFRVDEIPQLFNVLKGDMSIVGPRPERPFFVEQFEKQIPGYKCRHFSEAGITGLAQVAGTYSTSAEDKLRYDLMYSKESSPLFDLKILLQTLKVVFMRDKAS